MPYKPARPCRKPGCPGLTTDPSGYCPAHKKESTPTESTRPSSTARGYNYRWQKASKRFLREHPLCVECEKHGRVEVATEVHHINPLTKGGSNNPENLMALCKSCHSKITAEEKVKR